MSVVPSKYKIVVVPGDGIGREVTPEAVKVLKACEEVITGLNFEFIEFEAGAMYYLKNLKEEYPPELLPTCRESHGIIFGAVGWQDARWPDGTYAGAKLIFDVRFGLDLYANVRPCRLYPNVPTPIKKEPKDVNMVIIRENTECLYQGIGGRLNRGGESELAIDVRVLTRKGCERVIRYAFELARSLPHGAPVDGKKRVTCIDKSNVLKGCVFWREVFNKVGQEYPDIEKDYAYVDAWTQWAIRRPEWYNVCVTSNMFGDIITDLAAAIQGGLGLAPSIQVGDKLAMAEPVHGSAPKYYGKRVANPLASILSVMWLMRYFQTKYQDKAAAEAATRIETAVIELLEEGKVLPRDLGGSARTDEVGDEIARKVKGIQVTI
ncbi:isocitrate/isopropylmalate dehydrogenase family protein [Candidatus Nezhaarchaeota archaeon WYZ-LMO8]|nr:MAG: isocitrate/isopropylmalate dehydrogenase family protein [Candidatus Nezhaarchaeota archaeon WYZ-LMO7]TDA34982.1 MAG: isocitrate/isopropylmalate dehydrogenase family protein [Candidatus Nezhaarchaeota archaeon WYZ-LMO8]